jgi:hypothetical protein
MADVQLAAPVREWHLRQLLWITVLAAVAVAPTELRSPEWQPTPVFAQPVLTEAWAVELASTWIASDPDWWHTPHELVAPMPAVFFADQLFETAVVDAELLWQLRQLLAGTPLFAEVPSACSSVSDDCEVRMS